MALLLPGGSLVPDEIRRHANSVARKAGYGFATSVVFGNEDKVVSHTFGEYVKNTTGKHVAWSYLSHFGWKNAHYQHAKTVVQIKPTARDIAALLGAEFK